MAQCVRCGYVRRKEREPFVCERCKEAEEVIDSVWEEMDRIFNQPKAVDFNHPMCQLCADLTFLTQDDPNTRVFYKISSLMLESAWSGNKEITERDLNRKVRTTRSLSEIFRVLEELNLAEVRTEKYQRVLVLKDKVFNASSAWEGIEDLTEQVKERSSNSFAGYILFYILHKLNHITDPKGVDELPYRERLRKLWATATLLLSKPYSGSKSVSELEIDHHLGKRGIVSALTIKQSLHNMYKYPTMLIKEVKVGSNGSREFFYSDSVIAEMTRLREERERAIERR